MSKNEVSSIKTNENVSGFESIGFCEKVSGFVKKYRVILYRVIFFSQIFIGWKYRVLYRVFPKKGQPDKKKKPMTTSGLIERLVLLQKITNN